MAVLENTSENPQKKFFVKTFGCQMNVADSDRMTALLAEKGLTPTSRHEEAELIILNGCSIREKAVHKAMSTLGAYYMQGIRADRKNPKKKPMIGIGGCVGQLEKDALFKHAPYVDFVFGTDTIDQLPEIVHRVEQGERHLMVTEFDKTMSYSTETKVYGKKAVALVNIMKGCDKYCTYCIVPFTRGREKSRTIDEVVNDVARMVASGVREITLLGQNVNSFGKGNPNLVNREPQELHNVIGKVGPRAGEENFPQLLRAIDTDPRCSALKRIRFTSSHPLDFSDELIACYAPASDHHTSVNAGGVARLASHLHLPVQSGSNRILQKMGRHHQIENYIAQMDQLRTIAPDVGLTSDIIVGFPSETEEDFQATLTLLDRVQFDNVYAFAYSPRPGTRASKMEDDVPDDMKNERLNRLLAHQAKISEARYAVQVGKIVEVFIENEAKNQRLLKNQTGLNLKVWSGRTSCYRVVNFMTDSPRNWIGRFVTARITKATSFSLEGEVIADSVSGLTQETENQDDQNYQVTTSSEVVA